MSLLTGAALGGGGGSLVGNILGLVGAFGKGGQDTREDIVNLIKRIELPDFDYSDITPAELSLVAEYAPSFYDAIIPDEVKTVQDSPELRDAQMRGLAHLERVEREGLPLAERLAAQEQTRSLARESGRVQEGIVDNMRARGRAGGGTELQARMAGAQLASERARGSGSDLARDAVYNRLQAAHDVGRAAGSIRAQDVNVSGQQANTINRFNEWAGNLLTGVARDAAMSQERADYANTGERQRTADFNATNRQATDERNLDRGNALLQANFGNQMAKVGLQAGAMEGVAAGEDREQAARAGTIRNLTTGGGQALGGVYDYLNSRPQPAQPSQNLAKPPWGSAHQVYRASPYGRNYMEHPNLWDY